MKRMLFVLAAILMVTSLAQAQGVAVNAKTVEFTASADHDALSIDGTPMVARYEMRIYTETGGVLFSTTDLGKPVPVAGKISVTNAVWFAGLTPRTKYLARVVAMGGTGEGVSADSNPFGNVGPPLAVTPAPVVKK